MAQTATPQRNRTRSGVDRSLAYKSSTHVPSSPRRARPARTGRLGSQQRVSVRGRRVAAVKDNSRIVRMVVLVALTFFVGVAVVMWISGMTTAQSFQLSVAQKQSTTLANEIESLERDAQVAKSGATIAKEAAHLGMVSPDQAGILQTNGNDVATLREPGTKENDRVTDVNSDSRPRGATSNPDRTNNVEGLAPQEAVIAGVGAQIASGNGNQGGGLPYESTHSSVPVTGNGQSPAANQPSVPAADQPAVPAAQQPATPAAPAAQEQAAPVDAVQPPA